MERIAFTGTRHLRDEDRKLMRALISLLPQTVTFVVGGCVGVDAEVARIGTETQRRVHLVLPADRRQVDPDWHDYCSDYEEMPEGTTYRDRDARLVELGERLIAFPEYPENHPRSKRSGTWLTVRIARRAGKQVAVVVLRSLLDNSHTIL